MGNFYTNYTLRGPSQQAVAKVLTGRSAAVTPEQNGCVVVFDRESERQDTEVIARLGAHLSRDLQCPVLAVLNHDDDIFWYQLHVNGELADEYNSSPDYFDSSDKPPSGPTGGAPQKLCRVFGTNNVAQVEAALRESTSDRGCLSAMDQHRILVEALGISAFGVGSGFTYLAGGEIPEGLSEKDLIRVT